MRKHCLKFMKRCSLTALSTSLRLRSCQTRQVPSFRMMCPWLIGIWSRTGLDRELLSYRWLRERRGSLFLRREWVRVLHLARLVLVVVISLLHQLPKLRVIKSYWSPSNLQASYRNSDYLQIHKFEVYLLSLHSDLWIKLHINGNHLLWNLVFIICRQLKLLPLFRRAAS